MTRADAIAREMEAIAHDVERIQALSRTRPHVFCEQKDLIARRLRTLASELRNAFGGAPAPTAHPFQAGRRTLTRGRDIRVEIRRTRAA